MTGRLNNYSLGAAALETATNSTSVAMNETRSNSLSTGYTNNSFPKSSSDVWTITYYDDYGYFNITGNPAGDSLKSIKYDVGSYNIQSKLATSNKGRVTGNMSMVLSDLSDVGSIKKDTLYSSIYYDKYGHVLRNISDNHLGGKDIITNLLEDITYLLTQSKQEHYKGAENIVLEKFFEFDHSGRLIATRMKEKNQPEFTLSSQKYNEIGEQIIKYLHSDQTTGSRSFRQKEDFQYNIRGWLTAINSPDLSGDNDLFGLQLFYNSTSGMGSLAPIQGLYNGNIVGMKWGTKGDLIRGYQFSYDNLNRILQSKYADGPSLSNNTDYYSETITGYDKVGNILGLKRRFNNTLVDDLIYNYFGNNLNRLQNITDAGSPSGLVDDYPGTSQNYAYDANGNMTSDGAKNFTTEPFWLLHKPCLVLRLPFFFDLSSQIAVHNVKINLGLIKEALH